eukprot:TRINITY_DN6899_c1_g1_i2.p4 TRINITY_DN6899_c1_g1~~TRINITY_DN6899_c1_g1_i2.p4  ORF type:complete len:106 (+),score=4.26 TRINITY_DN6899_c1_g1_i2:467-784(+)
MFYSVDVFVSVAFIIFLFPLPRLLSLISSFLQLLLLFFLLSTAFYSVTFFLFLSCLSCILLMVNKRVAAGIVKEGFNLLLLVTSLPLEKPPPKELLSSLFLVLLQ